MNSQATDIPAKADGRNVDPGLGLLEGEGAQQRVKSFVHEQPTEDVIHVPASTFVAPGRQTTYYDQPAIKPTVWSAAIPAYFYVGGLAGATSVVGAAAQLFGRGRFKGFQHRARWVATLGDALSAGLLIVDLGRPKRFLYMMRVFRPTSPMNMGTWILSASGALNGASLLLSMLPWRQLRRLAEVGDAATGFFGLGLSGYTAVLVANTAVPVWQGAYRTLPPLFVSSSLASAGSLFNLMPLSRPEASLVRRIAIAGQLGELVFGKLMEREVGRSPEAARPLHRGFGAALWKASKLLTAARLALMVLPGDSRRRRRAAGLLGTLGALGLRFGLFQAGRASANDPRGTFGQQRRGLGANEVTQLSAVAGPAERALTSQPVQAYRLPVLR